MYRKANVIVFAFGIPFSFAYLRLLDRQPLFGKFEPICASSPLSHGDVTQKPFILESAQAYDLHGRDFLDSKQFTTDDPRGIRLQEINEEICDSKERQLTGHINVTEHKSIFFWFHESRRDPKNDPLIIWLSGGPGASSAMGVLAELGPCNINEDMKNTTRNPYSWTNFANLLFVDQPAGVGFSTVTNDSFLPYNLDIASTDFSTFLRRFFKHAIPEYSSHIVHLMGESFGGTYGPSFLTKINDQRARLTEFGEEDPFPKFESLVIADGLLDWAANFLGLYATTCIDRHEETGVKGPLLNDTACDLISSSASDCDRIGNACRATLHGPTCNAAYHLCEKMGESYWDLARAGLRSPYDMRSDCPDRHFCLEDYDRRINEYLNQDKVIKALGLPNTTTYKDMNYEINRRFKQWDYDFVNSVVPSLSRVMEETDMRVLVYNGNADWIINTPGVLEWMDILPWSGNGEFRASFFNDWSYQDDGILRKGGTTKQTRNGRLVFAGIDNAGHLAPYDQPAALESLIKSWVENKFGKVKLGPSLE